MNFKEDKRYKQANKEALIALGLYVFYFIWWYAFAYGLGSKPPSEYTFILGLPSWFFMSCIVGYLLISFIVWFVVRKFFVDMSFEIEDEHKKANNQ